MANTYFAPLEARIRFHCDFSNGITTIQIYTNQTAESRKNERQ